MKYDPPVYRPPSEAHSLILQATIGCPYNRCIFCDMYKLKKFRKRTIAEIKADIQSIKNIEDVRTVFLADSNSLILKTETLLKILKLLYNTFPNLERVTSYGRAKTILKKRPDDLKKLKNAGLKRLHVGLETGDDELLEYMNKGATASEMIEAGRKVMEADIELTEYVVLGLGGEKWWHQHAMGTAAVLNEISPTWIRVRTLLLRPNAPLYEKVKMGEFTLASPEEIIRETRVLIDNLEVTSEFLSDHVSNYIQVNGVLPQDKPDMIAFIDLTLKTLRLVPESSSKILQPEYLRNL